LNLKKKNQEKAPEYDGKKHKRHYKKSPNLPMKLPFVLLPLLFHSGTPASASSVGYTIVDDYSTTLLKEGPKVRHSLEAD
jgi:hypothetical protein